MFSNELAKTVVAAMKLTVERRSTFFDVRDLRLVISRHHEYPEAELRIVHANLARAESLAGKLRAALAKNSRLLKMHNIKAVVDTRSKGGHTITTLRMEKGPGDREIVRETSLREGFRDIEGVLPGKHGRFKQKAAFVAFKGWSGVIPPLTPESLLEGAYKASLRIHTANLKKEERQIRKEERKEIPLRYS